MSEHDDITTVGCILRIVAALAMVIIAWIVSSTLDDYHWKLQDVQRRIGQLESERR